MKDKELIEEMYKFAMELADDMDYPKFVKHRGKWNRLMGECEIKIYGDDRL